MATNVGDLKRDDIALRIVEFPDLHIRRLTGLQLSAAAGLRATEVVNRGFTIEV